MDEFRENVAISIDGGGIKGVIVTKALSMLEEELGKKFDKSLFDVCRLFAGTSTGSIIAAGLGSGLSASQLHELYIKLGGVVFRKSIRTSLWLLYRYRYPHAVLESALNQYISDRKVMGDFWSEDPKTDVVITMFDLVENRTRFVKPWKKEYVDWPVTKAVLASSSIPTYFPVVDGRYVDGGVGAYANPCYIAAYEILYCLKWNPAETTLISLGTGRDPGTLKEGDAGRFKVWDWIKPILGAFLRSADDQQVHLVSSFFEELDFRRFQVDLRESIDSDNASMIPELTQYGRELGEKILNDVTDGAMDITPAIAKF